MEKTPQAKQETTGNSSGQAPDSGLMCLVTAARLLGIPAEKAG